MASVTSASLNINFDTVEVDSKIVLEQMTRTLMTSNALLVRCFPSRDVSFVITVGRITEGNILPQTVTESLKFSGSSSVELKYPEAQSVTLSYADTFLRNERLQIERSSDISLRFNEERNAVVATRTINGVDKEVEIWGYCIASYTALYKLLFCYPDVTGTINQIGSLFAYNDKTVEVLDFELDSNEKETEYARMYRKIVLTIDGAFEAPSGWPNNTVINGRTLDPDNSFTDEILKEVAMVNQNGSIRFVRYNAPLLDEIIPTYYWTVANPSDTFWREVFLKVTISYVEGIFDLDSGTSPLILEIKTARGTV